MLLTDVDLINKYDIITLKWMNGSQVKKVNTSKLAKAMSINSEV